MWVSVANLALLRVNKGRPAKEKDLPAQYYLEDAFEGFQAKRY
jgi:hypothetical protein